MSLRVKLLCRRHRSGLPNRQFEDGNVSEERAEADRPVNQLRRSAISMRSAKVRAEHASRRIASRKLASVYESILE